MAAKINHLFELAWGKGGGSQPKCNHDWVPWSGKQRCRLCGVTKS